MLPAWYSAAGVVEREREREGERKEGEESDCVIDTMKRDKTRQETRDKRRENKGQTRKSKKEQGGRMLCCVAWCE